ncbi:MAG: sigma-70 family RNA polymerase sigma factor [Planctomycetota bacterium]
MPAPSSSITTTALLVGLRDPANAEAWKQFMERYHPIVLGVARRLRFSPSDAEDVAQDVLVRFLRDYAAGGYSRERGRLRTWIVAMTRARAIDHLRRAGGGPPETQADPAELPDQDALERIWAEETRDRIVADSLELLRRTGSLREETIRAFELTTLQERPATEVASELGLTTGAVYIAKHRCLERLRGYVAELEARYEEAG